MFGCCFGGNSLSSAAVTRSAADALSPAIQASDPDGPDPSQGPPVTCSLPPDVPTLADSAPAAHVSNAAESNGIAAAATAASTTPAAAVTAAQAPSKGADSAVTDAPAASNGTACTRGAPPEVPASCNAWIAPQTDSHAAAGPSQQEQRDPTAQASPNDTPTAAAAAPVALQTSASRAGLNVSGAATAMAVAAAATAHASAAEATAAAVIAVAALVAAKPGPDSSDAQALPPGLLCRLIPEAAEAASLPMPWHVWGDAVADESSTLLTLLPLQLPRCLPLAQAGGGTGGSGPRSSAPRSSAPQLSTIFQNASSVRYYGDLLAGYSTQPMRSSCNLGARTSNGSGTSSGTSPVTGKKDPGRDALLRLFCIEGVELLDEMLGEVAQNATWRRLMRVPDSLKHPAEEARTLVPNGQSQLEDLQQHIMGFGSLVEQQQQQQAHRGGLWPHQVQQQVLAQQQQRHSAGSWHPQQGHQPLHSEGSLTQQQVQQQQQHLLYRDGPWSQQQTQLQLQQVPQPICRVEAWSQQLGHIEEMREPLMPSAVLLSQLSQGSGKDGSSTTGAEGEDTPVRTSIDAAAFLAATPFLTASPFLASSFFASPFAAAYSAAAVALDALRRHQRRGSSCLSEACELPFHWQEIVAKNMVNPLTGRRSLLLCQNDVIPTRKDNNTAMSTVARSQLPVTDQAHPPRGPQPSSKPRSTETLPGRDASAQQHSHATVMCMDIVEFAAMTEQVEPPALMLFLGRLDALLDELGRKHRVRRAESIGGRYVVVVAGGLQDAAQEDVSGAAGYSSRDPQPDPGSGQDGPPAKSLFEGGTGVDASKADPLPAVGATPLLPTSPSQPLGAPGTCAARVYAFARDVLSECAEMLMPVALAPIALKIGVHTGPCISSLAGTPSPRFSLFGESVNVAVKLCHACEPGHMLVTEVSYELLARDRATSGTDNTGGRLFEAREWQPSLLVEVKVRCSMQTFKWHGSAGSRSGSPGAHIDDSARSWLGPAQPKEEPCSMRVPVYQEDIISSARWSETSFPDGMRVLHSCRPSPSGAQALFDGFQAAAHLFPSPAAAGTGSVMRGGSVVPGCGPHTHALNLDVLLLSHPPSSPQREQQQHQQQQQQQQQQHSFMGTCDSDFRMVVTSRAPSGVNGDLSGPYTDSSTVMLSNSSGVDRSSLLPSGFQSSDSGLLRMVVTSRPPSGQMPAVPGLVTVTALSAWGDRQSCGGNSYSSSSVSSHLLLYPQGAGGSMASPSLPAPFASGATLPSDFEFQLSPHWTVGGAGDAAPTAASAGGWDDPTAATVAASCYASCLLLSSQQFGLSSNTLRAPRVPAWTPEAHDAAAQRAEGAPVA